jgi:type IV secretory pathway VirB10-like protein
VRHWVGSLLAHGVLVLLLAAVRPGREAPRARSTRIEIVDVAAVPAPEVKDAGGGGAPAAPAQPRQASRARPRPRPLPRPVQTASQAAPIQPAAPAADVPAASQPAPDGSEAGSDRGSGNGDGGGVGTGAGTGTGAGSGPGVAPAEPPIAAFQRMVAAPRSKARPPILIYPKRERPVDADRLFIAALTIDRDGRVVGARLVRGIGGHADDRAMDAVWRFAYLPALDDAGTPIRARIEQQFMVE